MTQVPYEQYIQHIGFAAYVYQHVHTLDEHVTHVFTLNGRCVAQIRRGSEETQYFIG